MKSQKEWHEEFRTALHENTRIEYYGTMKIVVAYRQELGRYAYFGQPIQVDHIFTLDGGAEVIFTQYDEKYLKDNKIL